MSPPRVLLMSLALGLLVAACGEPPPPPPAQDVLEGFETGAARPEVLVALPVGPGIGDPDRLVVGYERDRYMIDGRGVEVLWVRRGGEEPLGALARADVNPVIFRDDALDGWGWSHFDSRAEAWSLRDRLVEDAGTRPDWAPDSGVEFDSADEARGRRPGLN